MRVHARQYVLPVGFAEPRAMDKQIFIRPTEVTAAAQARSQPHRFNRWNCYDFIE